MPGKACLKLKGKARADCLAYKGKYAKKSNKKAKKRVMAKHGGHGERIMRSMGSPSGGENAALMNATEDRAGTPFVSRGAGATLRGIKFKGLF